MDDVLDKRLHGEEKRVRAESHYGEVWTKTRTNLDNFTCEFCSKKIMEESRPGHYQEGYVGERLGRTWVCLKCFDDFKERFSWKVSTKRVKNRKKRKDGYYDPYKDFVYVEREPDPLEKVAIYSASHDPKFQKSIIRACAEYVYIKRTKPLPKECYGAYLSKINNWLPWASYVSHGNYGSSSIVPGFEGNDDDGYHDGYTDVRRRWQEALADPKDDLHRLAKKLSRFPDFVGALDQEQIIVWRFDIKHIVRGAYKCKAFRRSGEKLENIYSENEIYKIYQDAYKFELTKGTHKIAAAFWVFAGALPPWDWDQKVGESKIDHWQIESKEGKISLYYDPAECRLVGFDNLHKAMDCQLDESHDLNESAFMFLADCANDYPRHHPD